MMTLGEASRESGFSKATLSKAIKSGRMSATRNADGSFSIDPVELFRAFPPNTRETGDSKHLETHQLTAGKRHETAPETSVWRELVDVLKEERDALKQERDRLLRVIEEQAVTTRQLTHQPTETPTTVAPGADSAANITKPRTWALLIVLAAVVGFAGAVLLLREVWV